MNHLSDLTFGFFGSGSVFHSSEGHWFDGPVFGGPVFGGPVFGGPGLDVPKLGGPGLDGPGLGGPGLDDPGLDGPVFGGPWFGGLGFGLGLAVCASVSARWSLKELEAFSSFERNSLYALSSSPMGTRLPNIVIASSGTCTTSTPA